ncbi:PIR Superfamily Protein [Plasmodium ovale wallikeri]|uniref:PIR Superfamily Protein n=1 Tax=Plasmodium ovale wallikeri TaxID=864142 RepID=A0A1A9AM35_PLAOA|nr:PIR Superfamily Protein [Plasmodium ovale wallikeri]
MEDERILLKNIDSLDFDSKLDNINGKCDNCSSCYKYGNNLKNPFSFQLLCHLFVKNIEYIPLSIELNGQNLKEKRYDDFIYWILNMINKMNEEIEQTEVNKIINELKNIWKNINGILQGNGVNESYLCDVSKIEPPLKFDDLKRKKRMSDYCQNFNTLYIKLTNHNKPNCRIYYDYFNKTKDIYKEISENCPKEGADTNNCPQICMGKDKDNDPEIIHKNLKCNITGVQEKQQKVNQEEKCNTEKDTLRSQLDQALVAPSKRAFDYSDPRTVFLILFTLWGIFLTFFFLCKITPFGSWIRNNLIKKKLVRDNFDELVEDESIYDYSEDVNTNMKNVNYNISYNSDWNPSQ